MGGCAFYIQIQNSDIKGKIKFSLERGALGHLVFIRTWLVPKINMMVPVGKYAQFKHNAAS